MTEKLLPRFKDPFINSCPKRTETGLCSFGIPGVEPRPSASRELVLPKNLNICGDTPLVIRLCEANLEKVCNGNPNNPYAIHDPAESLFNIKDKHPHQQ